MCVPAPVHQLFYYCTFQGVCVLSRSVISEPHVSYTVASLVAQTVKRLPAMWETWVLSLGQEDPLEKEMATHSSTHAWKILWTKEPGRLQSMGSQTVGHDWATSLLLFSSPTLACRFFLPLSHLGSPFKVLYYKIRCVLFIFCICFLCMYYFYEKYYKPITIQYYIVDCVSWVPRLTYKHAPMYLGDLLH